MVLGDRGTVVLAPDRPIALRWSLVGIAATALALWVAVDAGDQLLAWAFAALCLVVTSYVGVQLLVPSRFQVRLDGSAVEVRLPWQHVRLPWERIHLARVVTVAGEPVLELHVWDTDAPSQASPRATGILLPLGADLPSLHAVLERQLGRADQAPGGELAPGSG